MSAKYWIYIDKNFEARFTLAKPKSLYCCTVDNEVDLEKMIEYTQEIIEQTLERFTKNCDIQKAKQDKLDGKKRNIN